MAEPHCYTNWKLKAKKNCYDVSVLPTARTDSRGSGLGRRCNLCNNSSFKPITVISLNIFFTT